MAAALIAAWLAAVLTWMLVDDIGLARAFGTPFPYLLFAISWFGGMPAYALLHDWHRDRLPRLLLLAIAGAAPFVALAWLQFLPGRAAFVTGLILACAGAATLALWSVLRLGSRQADE